MYSIVEEELPNTDFYSHYHEDGRLVLVLNPRHPFYKQLYRPLCDAENDLATSVKGQIELVMLAAARSEANLGRNENRQIIDDLRSEWSDIVASFLKN